MASINFRIENTLKDAAYRRLAELGVTPLELIQQAFEYVAETGKLPVQRAILSDDEHTIVAAMRGQPEAAQGQSGAHTALYTVPRSRSV